jgi:hypothetical protein
VAARLAQEFRRHHLRRRRTRTALVVSLVASLALASALLLSLKPVRQNAPTMAHQPAVVAPGAGPATQNPTAQTQTSQTSRKTAQTATSHSSENDFVALDTYDPATTPTELQIVRLELTGADLRLVGAPVAEDLSDRRLLADIVIGNDGTPYAVRLVR